MADNKPDFREEAYILEKMELSDDEDDGDFKYEEIKEGADGLDASGLDNISLKDDDDDDHHPHPPQHPFTPRRH
jgi:hypothetical protein